MTDLILDNNNKPTQHVDIGSGYELNESNYLLISCYELPSGQNKHKI
jgi:hypothetical protein